MEFDFFNYYLKGKGNFNAGEATIFVTGSNEWKTFNAWPPKELNKQTWWLNKDHELLLQKAKTEGKDEYVSDPANPVPYIDKRSDDRINEYMGADKVLLQNVVMCCIIQVIVLQNDITLLGPITANLSVSLSNTDADFIVKVIDVLPDNNQTQQTGSCRSIAWKIPQQF